MKGKKKLTKSPSKMGEFQAPRAGDVIKKPVASFDWYCSPYDTMIAEIAANAFHSTVV